MQAKKGKDIRYGNMTNISINKYTNMLGNIILITKIKHETPTN